MRDLRAFGVRQRPRPVLQQFRFGDHVDAIDRTRLHTQFAAGAVIGDDGVILFRRADNGIDRTRLDAERAADALIFAHKSESGRRRLFLHGFRFHPHQIGDLQHGAFAAGNAVIHFGFAARHRRGVGLATRIAALTALGLRQQRIDFIHHRIAFNMEDFLGDSQNQAGEQRKCAKAGQSIQ